MNILEYENYQEKILHGDPLFPYITYLCSIPLDFGYVPMHWHDEMEIIYIKKETARSRSISPSTRSLQGISHWSFRDSFTQSVSSNPNPWSTKISFFIQTCWSPRKQIPATRTIWFLYCPVMSLCRFYIPRTVHTMRRFLPASTRTMKSVKLIRPVISSLSKGSYFCCFIFCFTNAAQRNHPGKTAANP